MIIKNEMRTPYLEFISESRYRTHGIETIKRNIVNRLYAAGALFDIDVNYIDDYFKITFYKLRDTTLEWLIQRCETLGYFPSVFRIDSRNIISAKNIDDFVSQIKKYKIPVIYTEICIRFETWLDNAIEDIPEILYHIFRYLDVDKIKRYGICPKSKNKISFHPDRIYLIVDLNNVSMILNSFKDIDVSKNIDIKYTIAKIDTTKIPEDHKFLLRYDPNYEGGYYTNQNISPMWITEILYEK